MPGLQAEVRSVKTESEMAKIASKFGLSKLNAACLHESVEAVAALLDDSAKTAGQGQNEIDEEGRTAVHYACQNKKEGATILELLLSRDFSLQVLTKRGSSPLHEACRNGNSDAVQFISGRLNTGNALLSAFQLQDKDGNTPFHLTCRGGHVNVVNTLMKSSYDTLVESNSVCTLNNAGVTSMGLAIAGAHLDTAYLLFDILLPGNPAVALKDFSSFSLHSQLVQSFRATECEPMNIFLLGDSGSGKSTLIKMLQAHCRSTLSALYTLLPYISHPGDKHKVGIIPNIIEYP